MQLEGQFILCGITDDEAKYAHVLSKIEPKQAREIKDVITRKVQNVQVDFNPTFNGLPGAEDTTPRARRAWRPKAVSIFATF